MLLKLKIYVFLLTPVLHFALLGVCVNIIFMLDVVGRLFCSETPVASIDPLSAQLAASKAQCALDC